MAKTTIKITGMHCASCTKIISKALEKHEAVSQATVNFATEKAAIDFNSKNISEEGLLQIIKDKGYEGHFVKDLAQEKEKSKKELNNLKNKVKIYRFQADKN